MTNKNLIQFRKGFVNLPASESADKAVSMSVVSELMQLGYLPNKEAMECMLNASVGDITQFYNDVIPAIKKMIGADASYRPFWPGFPEQVMAMTEFELWMHQLAHYWTGGAYMPNDWTKARPQVFERNSWVEIGIGNDADLDKIFTDLVSVNQSLTKEDLEIVEWFAQSGRKLVFPATIPFKENLCTLAKYKLPVPVKTTTDVLRIAVGMSGGDISMPPLPPATMSVRSGRHSYAKVANGARKQFEFAKFGRADRRYILGLLEGTNCDTRDMVPHAGRWVRLAEVLHPGEYAKQFPRAYSAIKTVRDGSGKSYMGQVDAAFKQSFDAGLDKLSERPGVFARMLDSLLVRNAKATIARINLLEGVSNKVLFELFRHMQSRLVDSYSRTVRVKGTRHTRTIQGKSALPADVVDSVQDKIKDVLAAKFAKLDPMGKVYIDELLKKIPVPTDMRSLNPAMKPTVRGERVPLGIADDARVIRAYVHWVDEYQDQDVDLGVTFVGSAGVAGIGWNTSHNASFATFSGDVRMVYGPCAEYVDIIVDEALSSGYRYALVHANDYTRRGMRHVPNCCFGWMERGNAESNAVFVPKSVENAIQSQSEAVGVLAMIVDLQTREYVFVDEDINGIPVASMQMADLLALVDRYSSDPKISVYDILRMHADARGGELVSLEEAESAEGSVFLWEDFSGSYVEILKYMGV